MFVELRLNVPVKFMSVFSHVETAPPLPGYYQYFQGVKCLLKDKVGKVLATTTIAF